MDELERQHKVVDIKFGIAKEVEGALKDAHEVYQDSIRKARTVKIDKIREIRTEQKRRITDAVEKLYAETDVNETA